MSGKKIVKADCYTIIKYQAIIYALFLHQTIYAQSLKQISSAAHYGFIIPHSVSVQNTAGSYPYGIELNYGISDTSNKTYELCNCIVNNYLNLMLFNYDNAILGNALNVNYAFEPQFKLYKELYFNFRGVFGLSYQSNPYHEVRNPTNMSYSTYLNFFLGLSTGVKQKINHRLLIHANANFLHTSNSGIKDPNKGVNWPTASLGVNYYLQDFENYSGKQKFPASYSKQKWLQIGIFYSYKLLNIGDKNRYPVYGLFAKGTIQTSRINGISISAEAYKDYSLEQKLLNAGLAHISSIRSGVMAGNTFILGRFTFSQLVGIYAYSPSPFFDRIYHRWNLNYCYNNKYVIGVSLKAHRHVANFADVRFAYRFNYN
jgi:hypothetical protein